MSSCPATTTLTRFLTDGLAPDEAAALRGHIEQCPACQERLAAQSADATPPPSGAHAASAELETVGQEQSAQARADGHTSPLSNPSAASGLTTAGEHAGETEERLAFLKPPRRPGGLGRLGAYEIVSILGRGGMGLVLEAEDENLGRVVAIKVLSPQLAASESARKRFKREAQAAAAVCHENVVTIHAVDEADGHPYLVMQLVAGVTLQDLLEKKGALPLEQVLRIGCQVAAGLAAAHAQGLVHRDIKPANVLLEGGGERVKITDFGLARAVDDASITQSGVIAGTPMYMSPEQAAGEVVDRRADLFSLGSVLYTLGTGQPPFRAAGVHGVIKRVIEDRPRPMRELNPGLPDWLPPIVDKLMAKKPDERFQSAEEVRTLLAQHLAHLEDPRAPKPAPLPGAEIARKEPSVSRQFAAGGLIGLGIFAACFFAAVGLALGLGVWPLGDLAIRARLLGAAGAGLAAAFACFALAATARRRGAARARRGLAVAGGVFVSSACSLFAAWFAAHGAAEAVLNIQSADPELTIVIEADNFKRQTKPGQEKLPPGKYEVSALRGGATLYSKTLVLSPAEHHVFRVPPEALGLAPDKAVPEKKPDIPFPHGFFEWRDRNEKVFPRLALDAGGKFLFLVDGRETIRGTFRVEGGEVAFSDEAGPLAVKGEKGRYRWTVDGKELSFTKIEDKSLSRVTFLTFAPFVKLARDIKGFFEQAAPALVFKGMPEEVQSWMDKENVKVVEENPAHGKRRTLFIHEISYGHQLLTIRNVVEAPPEGKPGEPHFSPVLIEKNPTRVATAYYHRTSPLGVVLDPYNWSEKPWRWAADESHADARLPAALIALAGDGAAPLPLGPLVQAWSEPPIAVVGVMGTGVVATYGRPYQFVDFYEPSPAIIYLSQPGAGATPTFTFVRDALERGVIVRVFAGPHRKTFAEKAPPGFYQVVVVEAGRTNERPSTNLISLEALTLFKNRSRDTGIICVHTSNRHIRLGQVVAATGTKAGLTCVIGQDMAPPMSWNPLTYNSEWVMLSGSKDRVEGLREPVYVLHFGDRTQSLPYTDLVRREAPAFAPRPDAFWTPSAPKTEALTDERPEVLEEYRVGKK